MGIAAASRDRASLNLIVEAIGDSDITTAAKAVALASRLTTDSVPFVAFIDDAPALAASLVPC